MNISTADFILVTVAISAWVYIILSRYRKYTEKPEENGFGRCYRCKISWRWGKGHTTYYKWEKGSNPRNLPMIGCFPLCENCWKTLGTGEKRLKYYKKLWAKNLRDLKDHNRMDLYRQTLEDWPLIKKAVLDGN